MVRGDTMRYKKNNRGSYILTDKGKQILENEYKRIRKQADDYKKLFGEER